MANKSIFKTGTGMGVSRNEAGGLAYQLSSEHALAQYVMTGCLNNTFYSDAKTQLETVIHLCSAVSPEFIARCALYSRKKGYMKDMPALLCAILSVRDRSLCAEVFPKVINNGKMLRNFVQIIRSGVVGRRSFGSAIRRLVREWLALRSTEEIFKQSIGGNPSFADIIKMVHPKGEDPERNALYRYLLGKEVNRSDLPPLVQAYEAFKENAVGEAPPVPFQLLTSLPLTREQWGDIARNAGWQMTRMNLNTFGRHGVFEDPELVKLIAHRLRDPKEIRKARVFPYQLLSAFKMAGKTIPYSIEEALEVAMELAVSNVPQIEGRIAILPDVSGSMCSSVTGYRQGATSAVQCIDVAALVTAAFLRMNRDAYVLPFEGKVVPLELDSDESIMSNAMRLAAIGGGSTSCSAPLRYMNEHKMKADLVVFVSDNQSWLDSFDRNGETTRVTTEWRRFKKNNPQAKMVCIDIQPYSTVQALEGSDVLNIGGFSDSVFEVINDFFNDNLLSDRLVSAIKSMPLEGDEASLT